MFSSAFISLLASFVIGTSGGWGNDAPSSFGNEAPAASRRHVQTGYTGQTPKAEPSNDYLGSAAKEL